MLAAAMLGACGEARQRETAPASRPQDSVSVVYEVDYADGSAGWATVDFSHPTGGSVQVRAKLPWESEVLRFPKGSTVALSARAEPLVGASLQCLVSTDQGFYGKEYGASGRPDECAIEEDL